MVDYSKWDNLVVEDSDEDEHTRTRSDGTPRVTRLDHASRVTFGGAAAKANGGVISIEQQQPCTVAGIVSVDDDRKHLSKFRTEPKQPNKTEKIAAKTRITLTRDSLFENGADLGNYLWTQDISQIFITLFTNPETRAKDINVSLTETGTLTIELYQSRTDISDDNSDQVNPEKKERIILLQGQLTKDVWGAPKARMHCKHLQKLKQNVNKNNGSENTEKDWESLGLKTNLTADRASESEKEAKELEWEIKDAPENVHSGRMIQIRLYKLPPHELIRGEWWDQLFLNDTIKFDTKTLKGRSNIHSNKANSFQQAWNEAHQKFIEKRKRSEKIELTM